VATPSQATQIKRGQVWLADIPGDKVRPVLVMTRSTIIPYLNSVIVAPVTSTIRHIPTEVPLSRAEGLLHDSVANFDNLQLVSKQRLLQRIGVLGNKKLEAACQALVHATGC
jgi:mRNA interferase MazF